MYNGNGNGIFGLSGNTYNESAIKRLSNVVEDDDPIAQAMGLQSERVQTASTPHEYKVVKRQEIKPVHTQNNQQITANGKTISVAISPDGTVTITIQG